MGVSLFVREIAFVSLLAAVGGPVAAEFTDEQRRWWAIQPVAEVAVPEYADDWARNEIDQFVGRRLDEAGLRPAPEAGRAELVRRAYFDLHGLPPTPAEVARFVNDRRPDAWERLVDDLLASPRYGERWAQHWLDVVRWAESDGYRQDAFRPDAWPYRDYVIASFNDDKPYDRFVMEQLAGDEIAPEDPDVIIGTAFLRNGIYEYNQRDVRSHWRLIVNELTNVTAEAFLGLGMACAQCHDHKFDPLLHGDYYRLQAFLVPVRWRYDLELAGGDEKAEHDRAMARWEEATAEIRREIDAIVEPKIAAKVEEALIKFPEDIQELMRMPVSERTPYEQQLVELGEIQFDFERTRFDEKKAVKGEEKERLDALRAELKEFEALKPSPLTRAFVATDIRGGEAPRTIMESRGRKTEVKPGVPSIIDAAEMEIAALPESTGRRLALARWITRKDNPLTARVMANRIWQHHFGRGIVATPNDFGTLGEEPTHPALLDWLAARFIDGGWKVKEMHRLMMNSATYRQTARREPGELERASDPENRLLWRYSPRRLSAEEVRDAALAVSGELALRTAGPSVDGSAPQRSIYVKKIRNSPDEVLAGFDAPDGFESVASREATNTATQSLLLANGEWSLKRAEAMARRMLGTNKEVTGEMVREVYRTAYSREPGEGEVLSGFAFVRNQRGVIEGERRKEAPPVPVRVPIGALGAVVDVPGLGDDALNLKPDGRLGRPAADGKKLESDEFTVETVARLESLYPDASVRTLVSRWDGNKLTGGWAFGVTSRKSRYEPRNLIMQLTGKDFQGNTVYEVVASGLRVPVGKPVYLAAAVSTTPEEGSETAGTVTFYLRDLSIPDSEMQVRVVEHSILAGLQSSRLKIAAGGRSVGDHHKWDGQLARLAIADRTLGQEELFISGGTEGRVLDWTFETGRTGLPSGATWLDQMPVRKLNPPALEAFTDFCHAIINSNEFLYLH